MSQYRNIGEVRERQKKKRAKDLNDDKYQKIIASRTFGEERSRLETGHTLVKK